MDDKKVKFIRKNGRIIPIKDDGMGKGEKGLNLKKEYNKANKTIKQVEKKQSKYGVIGASLGAGVATLRGKFSTMGLITHMAIGTAAGAILAGGSKKRKKAMDDQSDINELKKLKGSSL